MVPSPEAISEFRVQTNSNNSEYGRYGGGVVNISSKSGTNEFHGSVYEYFRNTVLNANLLLRKREQHRKAAVQAKPVRRHLRRAHQEEQAVLLRHWEGYRSREGANYLGTVPLPEMYNGDFSNFRNASNAGDPDLRPADAVRHG